MDESDIDRHLHRQNARSAKGKKVIGFVAGKKFHRMNIVAGYVDGETIAECLYNYATDGEVLFGFVAGKKFQRRNIVAGYVNGETIAECVYDYTTDGKVFNAWVKQSLVAALKPGQVVLMDNGAFHKHRWTREAIEATGCSLIFLP
ncbi:MAG: transposase, partial [Puniceicoccales bacterium]|nr:transposase [Puniceicoccales bacterium]